MESRIKPGMMKYCVIGNIVKERTDDAGIVRHGTVEFPGGRKVYISRRLWIDGEVTVMGLSRFKSEYILERVPLIWIDNIRASKSFSPRVLELMTNNVEQHDMWWLYKEEDKIGSAEYARILNQVKAGDKEALEQYTRDAMSWFY